MVMRKGRVTGDSEGKKMMTQPQAIRILIKAAERQVKRLHVNANLYEVYGLDEPGCKAASEERRRIIEAITALQDATRT